MSGGSFDYEYSRIRDAYAGQMCDEELDGMMEDLIPLLKSLEWWQSADISEEEYRAEAAAFKAKWFDRSPEDSVAFYADRLQAQCDRMKRELGYRGGA